MNFTPTDLRISTHTATCNINSLVNLSIIAKYLDINEHITYIECGPLKKGINHKIQSKKAKQKKRVFFNQITFIVSPTKGRFNNVKLFNNGAISMTGLKELDEGEKSVKLLLDYIKNIKGVYYYELTQSEITRFNNEDIQCSQCKNLVSSNNVKKLICDNHYICNLCCVNDFDKCNVCLINLKENGIVVPSLCKIKDYKIVLINSDYYLGFEVKRDVLHTLLCNEYKIYSSYESCIYPGVNSKYYFNEEYKDFRYKGKCYCDVFCDGKGNGIGAGKCKKITISIFQSGSIIITGARNIDQINIAYKFINTVINDNYETIKKQESFFKINEKKKILKLKKTNILNYPSDESITQYLTNQ